MERKLTVMIISLFSMFSFSCAMQASIVVIDSNESASGGISCPTGYVAVPGDVQLGTNSFCTMQMEARAWNDTNGNGVVESSEVDSDGCAESGCTTQNWGVGTYLPTTLASAYPWRNVSATTAKSLCTSLGSKYDLMSNPEWMTIARNAEKQASNWYSGSVGSTVMVTGNTKASNGIQPILDLNDEYTGSGSSVTDGPGTGWEHRRTIYLSNGSKIWDMPGNAWEWVDWDTGGTLTSGPTICTSAEINAVACSGLSNADYNSSTGLLYSAHRAGKFIGGTGGQARRGGQTGDDASLLAGIYEVALNRDSNWASSTSTFRCVYRP